MSAARNSSSRDDDPEDRRDVRADSPALLRRIGDDLDQHKKLVVYRGGTVMPSTGRPSPKALGEDCSYEGSRNASAAGRSETGQGARAAEGSSAGAREGGSAAPLFRERGVDEATIADIEAATDAREAYPQLRVRFAPRGIIWLEGEIQPVEDQVQRARVLVAYPLNKTLLMKSWAWWKDGRWIGPRHTNYGDGSICAYELPDDTWSRQQPLIAYLDLVSIWITRHLYLEIYGRWPGRQVLHTTRERLMEHRPGEICGGCHSGRKYDVCHRPLDMRKSATDIESEYRKHFGYAVQLPPESPSDFERLALTPHR